MLHFVSEYDPTLTDEQVVPGINLTAELITNPNSTFLVRMTGEELISSGIFRNDLLVVDKSYMLSNGKLILAFYNLQPVVRYYYKHNGKISLSNKPDPSLAQAISVNKPFQFFGVVTAVVRQLHAHDAL